MALDITECLLLNKRRARHGEATVDDDIFFEQLARHTAKSRKHYDKDPGKYQEMAREAYAGIAAEIGARTTVTSCPEIMKAWVETPPLEVLRSARRYHPDLQNQNIRITAMRDLRTAFDVLPDDQLDTLRRNCPDAYRVDLENLERMLEWGSKKNKASRSADPEPGRWAKSIDALRQKTSRMKAAVNSAREAYGDLPFGAKVLFATGAADAFEVLLDRVDAESTRAEGVSRRRTMVAAEVAMAAKLGRKASQRLLNETMDVTGNIDALLGIIDRFQMSEGEGDAARVKALEDALYDELISRIPIYGKARGLCRAWKSDNRTGFVEMITPMLAGRFGATSSMAGPVGVLIFYKNFAVTCASIIGHEIFAPPAQGIGRHRLQGLPGEARSGPVPGRHRHGLARHLLRLLPAR